MTYFLVIHKESIGWMITDTIAENRNIEYEQDKYYKCTKELYDYVNNLLNMKKNLYVQEDKLGFDGAHITRYDIIAEDQFGGYQYIEKERKIISNNWDIYNTIQLFKLIFANNKLIEKGYILTPENQEEVVSKMIEKEDKEALSLYETFYSAETFFEKMNEGYERIKELETLLSDVKSDEEAQKKYDEWKLKKDAQ